MASPRPMGSGPRSSPRPRPGRSQARRSGIGRLDGWRRREGDRGGARCGGDDGQVDAAALHDEAERDPGGQHQDQDRRDVSPSAAAPDRRGGLRVLERRGALEVPRAVCMSGAQADELLLALRTAGADRRSPRSGCRPSGLEGAARRGRHRARDRKNGQTAGSGERAASSRIDSGGGRGCWAAGAATWGTGNPASGGGGLRPRAPACGVAIGAGRRRPVAQVQTLPVSWSRVPPDRRGV